MHQEIDIAPGGAILVVDDTKVNIDILVDTLKDVYTLSVATNGQRALDQALHRPPDLVLLDIMMPGMDGYEVCRRLKQHEATRNVPVIFITALTESQSLVKGFNCGAVDYITKPIDPAEVRARVRTHISLLRARQELERKSAELAESNSRLRELDDIKSSFLSSVAHELRTPLTSILGFAKLVRKDFDKAFRSIAEKEPKLDSKANRIRENLAIVSQEGERLSRMINDVLDLTKIESGRIQWRNEPFHLEPVIQLAAQAVQGLFDVNKDLDLKLEFPEQLPQLVADRDRIEQVLINLLHNAAKFTSEGHVVVRVTLLAPSQPEQRERVRISVEDTGMGIPEGETERIFNKFHQVVTDDTLAPDRPRGTGLGLPICKQIVEHYGGRIWAQSTPGQGATVSFELPIIPPHEVEACKQNEA